MSKNNLFSWVWGFGLIILISLAALNFLLPGGNSPVVLVFTLFAGAVGAGFGLSLGHRRSESGKRKFLESMTATAMELESALSAFGSGNLTASLAPVEVVSTENEHFKLLEQSLVSSVEAFRTITAIPSARLFFSGCNSYAEGRLAGESAHQMLQGKGMVACFIPSHRQVNHDLRYRGFRDYLRETRSGVELIGVFETQGNRELAIQWFRKIVDQYPMLNLVYITDGFTPWILGEWFAREKEKGRVLPKVMCFDVIPDNVQFLKSGIFHAIVEQNLFAQSYNSLVLLYNAMESGWRPVSRKLFHTPRVVQAKDLSQYWDMTTNTRSLTSEEKAMLVEPVPSTSGKKYLLAIILPVTDGFAQSLTDGAQAAVKKLKDFNVQVEIVDAFEDWNNFGSAEAFNPRILKLAERGFHGVATTVFDPEIVDAINKVSRQGVLVASFNSEPSSFRELVASVVENGEILAGKSLNLAASAEESSRAHTHISQTIDGITGGIERQESMLGNSNGHLQALNDSMESALKGVERYAGLVDEIEGETSKGAATLHQAQQGTIELQGAMEGILRVLGEFRTSMGQINSMVETIKSFAEETKVLAINAAVQAARAGEAGRGFTVVSSEVSKLANNSQVAVDQIRVLIDRIHEHMNEVVVQAERGRSLVDQEVDTSRSAVDAFGHIAQLIRQSGSEIQQIVQVYHDAAKKGASVRETMREIENLGRENMDRMGEMGNSIRELDSEGRELSATANDLQSMADSQKLIFAQLTIHRDDE